jgi:sulfur carrier protein ThiS
MKHLFLALGLWLLACLSSQAQNVWVYNIRKDPAGVLSITPALAKPIQTIAAASSANLVLHYDNTIIPTPANLSVTLITKDAAGQPTSSPIAVVGTPTTADATYSIAGSSVDASKDKTATIEVAYAGAANPIGKIAVKLTGPAPTPNGNNQDKTPSTVLGCLDQYPYPDSYYDEARNEATFIVSVNGNVVARPTEPIDEDDKIIVHVVGPQDLLDKLVVERKSAFRAPGAYRIVGEGNDTFHESRFESDCNEVVVQLADFEPGRGQVQLSRLDANGRSTAFSEFDFGVNPLYRGAFSFGPVYSWLTDRSFGTVNNQITVTEQSPRVHYVLSYTHYIWGRRDDEKPNRQGLLHQLYPTFGLSLQNTLKNVFAGVTYDILGTNIYLTAGAHVGRVTVIDPTSGLSVGSTLPTTLTSVPTRSETDADWFIGLSLDLRAATKFLGLFGKGTATTIGR